ncbi:hypothetical protein Tco_0524761 [Tanacetum coccineum]
MNSLITFIRSRVIWEIVHDFQLGIESYQIKVNLTASTLTFPGIEAHEPYSIFDKLTTGLIYLNNKDEKRVMYLVEIVKFCDATLEKVLKEVKLKIFQSKPWKKPPLLGVAIERQEDPGMALVYFLNWCTASATAEFSSTGLSWIQDTQKLG